MINMNEEGAWTETGPDVYLIPPAEYHIQDILTRLVNYSERQREKAAPDIIDLSPVSGSQVVSTYTTKTSLRVLGVLFSGGTATDEFNLMVGSRPYRWRAGTTGQPVFINLPIDVARGIDLLLIDRTVPSAVNWTAMVYAYAME